MAKQYIVTAAAVKVSIGGAGGNRIAQFLRRGDVVPEGVVEEQLERLEERGLIAELPDAEELLAAELAEQAERDAIAEAAFDAKVAAAAQQLVADRDAAEKARADQAAGTTSQTPATPAKAPAAKQAAK
jgi:hypothetical protein